MCKMKKCAIVVTYDGVFFRREIMKTKIAGMWILITVLMLSLLAGCSSDAGQEPAAPEEKTERNGKYVVGEGIQKEDITEFVYTIGTSTNPPLDQRYRFYTEDGSYWFYHETREGDVWPLTEEHISVSGTLELSSGEWDAFLDCLEGGSVKKRTDDANSGGTRHAYSLYWNGDREKYRVFTFSSSKKDRAFEELCMEYTERSDTTAVKTDPDGKETLSGKTTRWSVAYFGISLPEEWDDLIFEYPSNIHRAPNYQELVVSIDNNWITLTPCSDQNINKILEYGYELVGVLTLPTGYPLYLTMDFHADPSTETGAWMSEHREELIDSISASDGAVLEKGVVYIGGPMIDMTGYIGMWNSDNSFMTLSIEDDGSFVLTNSAEGETEREEPGYLVYRDGEYHMYDEFDRPFGGVSDGNTYLYLNDDDMLTWVEGMGAVLFYHEAAGGNQSQSGPAEFKPLYGTTWSVDGAEGTASIEFDFGSGFIMYYANGNTEATGTYIFYEMNGALYCGLERDDGTTIDMKAYYNEGAGQYILEYNGMYYMERE